MTAFQQLGGYSCVFLAWLLHARFACPGEAVLLPMLWKQVGFLLIHRSGGEQAAVLFFVNGSQAAILHRAVAFQVVVLLLMARMASDALVSHSVVSVARCRFGARYPVHFSSRLQGGKLRGEQVRKRLRKRH